MLRSLPRPPCISPPVYGGSTAEGGEEGSWFPRMDTPAALCQPFCVMTEVHTAQGGTPPTDGIDYEAAFKLAWSAFTRKPVELIVGMLIATLLAFLIITVGAVALGVNHQALQAVRGRDIKIGDALAGFSEFGMSLGAVLLVILAVIIGTALCVVPGIIAAFGFY